MKKLLCAMASIALMTSPVAIAQPDHQQGRQQDRQHETRGEGNRQGQQRQGQQRQVQQRQAQRQVQQRQVQQRQAQRQVQQRQVQQRQVQQRQVQRQVWQRQAANRAYNASTYRSTNYGYADPARYRSNRVHSGWAQDRGNTYRWREGERMGYYDWYYAPRVSYRRYHLRRPPYGYEWRRYDDRYVLVAITTGLIMSVILDAAR